MASIVSAGTTSATALNMSADTSGVLQLASNNGTVALTVATNQAITLAGALTTGGNLAVVGQMTLTSVNQDQVTIQSGSASSGASLVLSNGNGTTSNNYSYIQFLNSQTSPQKWNFGTFGSSSLTWQDVTANVTRMSLNTSNVLQVGNTGTGEAFAQNTVKVWGSLIGSTGAMYNSFGISSSSKVSTGIYAIGFVRTLSNSRFGSAGSQYGSGIVFLNTESTTGCRVNTTNTSGTAGDADCMFLIAGGS